MPGCKFRKKIHNSARSTTSPIEHDIEGLAALLPTNPTMDNNSLNCTPQQIKHIIKKLPSNKAPGLDKITTMSLKKLPIKPIVQIYYIFKACLKLSYFPTAWKTAKVILIQKQEKPATAVESYRPISLLSTISKLFEKIIITHLVTHVKNIT